jgi:hypothetical protein
MPAKRFPGAGLGLKPLAAALAASAVALVASAAVARLRRLLATTGGPIVILLANGKLLRAERLLFSAGPDRRLRYAAIGTAPGDGPEDFSTGILSLAPAQDVVTISMIDSFFDGIDSVLAIRSTTSDSTLFSGTDNTLAPPDVWSGDDPAAPAWLLAEQAIRDAEWQEWLKDDPTIPRPIVIGRFDDVSSDGEASPDGWTAAGALRVVGRTRPRLTLGAESWPGDELAPWWAVIAPASAGAWSIIARGHGSIPASWAAVPSPAPVLALSADPDGRLLVDGVAQSSPMLEDAVIAVAGPFA